MTNESDTLSLSHNSHAASPLAFNPDDYRQDIAHFDMTQSQQDEMLAALWNIMKTMVEIGWGVNNVQYLLPELFAAASAESPNNDNPHERNANDE
jgi:hypothetical protein